MKVFIYQEHSFDHEMDFVVQDYCPSTLKQLPLNCAVQIHRCHPSGPIPDNIQEELCDVQVYDGGDCSPDNPAHEMRCWQVDEDREALSVLFLIQCFLLDQQMNCIADQFTQ